jgi:hypothetical protein
MLRRWQKSRKFRTSSQPFSGKKICQSQKQLILIKLGFFMMHLKNINYQLKHDMRANMLVNFLILNNPLQ